MSEPIQHDSELRDGPSAEAFDPVIEVFKRDIDFTIVERNLRLSTKQRAQQLVRATRFLDKFRPLVASTSGSSRD